LNPVIDRVYFINQFKAGQLYRDNRPAICTGGKGINVAKVLAQLGEACTVYGFIGGSSGERVKTEIILLGIQQKFIEIGGDTRTTINIIDHDQDIETEILEVGPTADDGAIQNLIGQLNRDIVSGDIVICSGAIIPGADLSIYQTISKICEAKQAFCFLDTFGETFQHSLPGHYYFAKPNWREFIEYTGMVFEEFDEDAIVKSAGKLIDHGLENLMISMGKNGAILINQTAMLRARLPVVSNQSSIGSGDASVAGFAVGIHRGWDIEESFCLSMACGISNAMHREVGFVDLQEVNELKSRIELTSRAVQK
jgi:tagatose 6-phosphate kinase